MSNMSNMPWTFLVVFMAIFAVILIAAVNWLMSRGPSHWHK
jgi:preprotein translocase subunit SecE